MRRTCAFLLVSSLLAAASVALDDPDEKVSFDGQAAWSYIKDLSTDSMLGRKSGHPGGALGEDYIASRFEEWGLEPAGDEGTYFQSFTVPYWNLGEGAFLEIWAGDDRRDFFYGEDWSVQRNSGSGHYAAEIVFAGYGIHAPEKGYDDYEGVDVEGKLVLFTTETPEKLTRQYEEETKPENRIKAAQELGARGILVFQRTPGTRLPRLRPEPEAYHPDFVVIAVAGKVTDFIIKELDTDYSRLYEQIEEESKPMSFVTGVKALVAVDAEFDPQRTTRNVLAKITGSDEALKNEFVVVGGHMDHLGVNHRGEVYNGANDNASGTAVAMEIARVMKLNDAKPKRTVVFAGWAAEEMGLLGSNYYCDQPTYPMEKTVMYINMDMVGHGGGNLRLRGEYYGPKVWAVLQERLPPEMVDDIEPGRGGPGGSDHTPFLEKGVPAFGAGTAGGSIKYHQVHDDTELIKVESLKKVGDMVHAAIAVMADEPGDFQLPRAQEVYSFKYQNLTNYRLEPLDMFLEQHGDVKDADVDVQLSVLAEPEELSGDALRVDIIDNLLGAEKVVDEADGLAFYSSSAGVPANVSDGKTTLLPGLRGVRSFSDNLQWAEVLAKQGAFFVMIDDPAVLFAGDALSDQGREMVEAIASAGMLLMVDGSNAAQDQALLDFSEKPLVLIKNDLPAAHILDLIKEKDSALGLLLAAETSPTVYFDKMEKVKDAIGTRHLALVNEQCLWEEEGRNQMLDVIAEIVKAEYEREDLANVFSATLLRIVDQVR